MRRFLADIRCELWEVIQVKAAVAGSCGKLRRRQIKKEAEAEAAKPPKKSITCGKKTSSTTGGCRCAVGWSGWSRMRQRP